MENLILDGGTLVPETSACPKCGGLTYTTRTYGAPTNGCTGCGLFYELGGNRESLQRQILGDAMLEEK